MKLATLPQSIDAAKGWPNTGRIDPQPLTAQPGRHVFAVLQDQRHRIANQLVLLIGDLMTTGATLYGAAKTPHQAGNSPIRQLVLARILRHGL